MNETGDADPARLGEESITTDHMLESHADILHISLLEDVVPSLPNDAYSEEFHRYIADSLAWYFNTESRASSFFVFCID